jgi:RHS repeat-associated protein
MVISSSGAELASVTYNPYGSPSNSNVSSYTPFGYAGGYTVAAGLIYLLHRWYDPSSAQFISVDPMLAVTQEPYSYVGGDPMNAVDPSGMCVGLDETIAVGEVLGPDGLLFGLGPGNICGAKGGSALFRISMMSSTTWNILGSVGVACPQKRAVEVRTPIGTLDPGPLSEYYHMSSSLFTSKAWVFLPVIAFYYAPGRAQLSLATQIKDVLTIVYTSLWAGRGYSRASWMDSVVDPGCYIHSGCWGSGGSKQTNCAGEGLSCAFLEGFDSTREQSVWWFLAKVSGVTELSTVATVLNDFVTAAQLAGVT